MTPSDKGRWNMAATAAFTILVFCFSGGESVTEAPAILRTFQKTFIEVFLVDPNNVESAEIATDVAPETIEIPDLEPSVESLEAIGKDVEPPDHIEPLFADDSVIAPNPAATE